MTAPGQQIALGLTQQCLWIRTSGQCSFLSQVQLDASLYAPTALLHLSAKALPLTDCVAQL